MTRFSDLDLPVPLTQALTADGFTCPTPIQQAAIPTILAGHDCLGRGPTGSGKTLAFGLPMIALLARGHSLPGRPRGLVLAPTRELAEQISERLAPLGAAMGLRILAFTGGVSIDSHLRQLSAPCDLAVGTPGRILDLVKRKAIDLQGVVITAIDEADELADLGFFPQIRAILDRTPPQSQRLLFSATLDGDVAELIDLYLSNPQEHHTSEVLPTALTHYLALSSDRDSRHQVLSQLANRPGKTLVFCRRRQDVDGYVRLFASRGLAALGLHGQLGPTRRREALEALRQGSVGIVVATDVAARGIDIEGIDLVIHADYPDDPKAYTHRAGRTGRAGRAGIVVTLAEKPAESKVRDVMSRAGITPEVVDTAKQYDALRALVGARRRFPHPRAAAAHSEGTRSDTPRSSPNRQRRAKNRYLSSKNRQHRPSRSRRQGR